jgi:GTP-binding protein Era
LTEKCGLVAVLGAPNAGKSTLVNALVGQKVAIVSAKAQTTRARLMGIALAEADGVRTQIILADTPGIFAPKRRLDRAMVTTAWGGAADADVIALLIDARKGLTDEVRSILESLAEFPAQQPRVLILNKVDVTRREALLELAAEANKSVTFDRTFMVSAMTGDGVPDLLDYFAERMPESPWLYPEDQMSDLPMRWIAAEVTREKLMIRLHEELPYHATVETEKWTETPKGIRIDQTIYVERDNQRKIVLGKDGQTIKAISMAARKDLSQMLERPVHLFLFVKVRENWSDDPERYREMGLEFPR